MMNVSINKVINQLYKIGWIKLKEDPFEILVTNGDSIIVLNKHNIWNKIHVSSLLITAKQLNAELDIYIQTYPKLYRSSAEKLLIKNNEKKFYLIPIVFFLIIIYRYILGDFK